MFGSICLIWILLKKCLNIYNLILPYNLILFLQRLKEKRLFYTIPTTICLKKPFPQLSVQLRAKLRFVWNAVQPIPLDLRTTDVLTWETVRAEVKMWPIFCHKNAWQLTSGCCQISSKKSWPLPSQVWYIYLYIWLIFVGNLGKCTMHGCYGWCIF